MTKAAHGRAYIEAANAGNEGSITITRHSNRVKLNHSVSPTFHYGGLGSTGSVEDG